MFNSGSSEQVIFICYVSIQVLCSIICGWFKDDDVGVLLQATHSWDHCLIIVVTILVIPFGIPCWMDWQYSVRMSDHIQATDGVEEAEGLQVPEEEPTFLFGDEVSQQRPL